MLKGFALAGAVYVGLLEAVSLYPVPTFVMAQLVKLATPADTVRVRPPLQLNTPPPGFVPSDSVTAPLFVPVSRLPFASSTSTEVAKVPVPAA
jgi:hypothetical protein